MKIIIAGAGNVGTHLAKLLSREKQDIILMDDDEEKLSALSANFDLLTVTASPSSISGLKEVGVKEADLFIAVTPDESRNMTACMLATNLGAKKTVARIDNYEYLLPKNKEFFRKLGVDSLIYPEMLAAKEIVSSMRMSWVRQWWEFCGGALILIGTKMREKAEILNIPLHQLGAPDIPYHVVAIKRGTETIIPRGDDVIKLHDIVYFTTTRKYIPYIRKIAGKEDYADVRNVMIMGGSRIAVRTAQYVPDYMQVKIVDNDINRCNRLTELLDDKTMIINGDGRDMDLLASLAFGIIIAEIIHELGVTDDKRVAFEISRSGVIAGVLMAIIYCGLALAGTQLSTVMPDATNGAAILARSASMHFGLAGTVVVFAIFFLACMNVCIGLISCCSRYFCETYVVKGGAEASEEAMRRPFAVLAFVFAAFSCVLSNVGLDVILLFSVPMLNALYPVAIVLVLMGLVHGFCDAYPQVWVWVGGVVAVQSVITSVRDAFFAGAWLPFDALPLADIGAAWAPVAVVAFVIGLLHSRFVAHSRS